MVIFVPNKTKNTMEKDPKNETLSDSQKNELHKVMNTTLTEGSNDLKQRLDEVKAEFVELGKDKKYNVSQKDAEMLADILSKKSSDITNNEDLWRERFFKNNKSYAFLVKPLYEKILKITNSIC